MWDIPYILNQFVAHVAVAEGKLFLVKTKKMILHLYFNYDIIKLRRQEVRSESRPDFFICSH